MKKKKSNQSTKNNNTKKKIKKHQKFMRTMVVLEMTETIGMYIEQTRTVNAYM